jgi:hypothetical protein
VVVDGVVDDLLLEHAAAPGGRAAARGVRLASGGREQACRRGGGHAMQGICLADCQLAAWHLGLRLRHARPCHVTLDYLRFTARGCLFHSQGSACWRAAWCSPQAPS